MSGFLDKPMRAFNAVEAAFRKNKYKLKDQQT